MYEELERINFALECVKLTKELTKLMKKYESDRVWVSVMCTLIKEISNQQHNPDRALQQVIGIIKSST
jgi:hypothetical protein